MADAARKGKVLIVEDNAFNVLLIRTLLAAENLETAVAVDAREALVAVAQFRPDLILMDLQLPDMDGLTLTRQLRAEHGTDLKIVALTAHRREDVATAVAAAGCQGLLTKPLDPAAFRQTIRGYLEGDR